MNSLVLLVNVVLELAQELAAEFDQGVASSWSCCGIPVPLEGIVKVSAPGIDYDVDFILIIAAVSLRLGLKPNSYLIQNMLIVGRESITFQLQRFYILLYKFISFSPLTFQRIS